MIKNPPKTLVPKITSSVFKDCLSLRFIITKDDKYAVFVKNAEEHPSEIEFTEIMVYSLADTFPKIISFTDKSEY